MNHKAFNSLKQLTRTAALATLMLAAALPAWGQSVIMYDVYYLKHGTDGHSVETASSTGFNPATCIWYLSNNTIKTANANGEAYSGNYFLQNNSVALGNSSTWTTAANGGNLRGNGNNYLRRSGTNGNWQINNTNSNRATAYAVNITSQGPEDNTTATISVSSIEDNTITFSHSDLTGTFVPQYTRYVFNGVTHNWYNNADLGSNVPSSVDANTLNPSYAWSLTSNGGGVATINSSTGVLTLSGAPTGNITVRLTVSNISPMPNKTIDFTLTRAAVAQGTNTVTEMTNPTVTPSTATLYFNDNQEFTSSATATTTTYNIPAHTTLTGDGNTYYYYNGTLYTNTTDFSTSTETHPAVTLTWSLSGTGAGNLSRTPATGTSTTVTHTPSASTDATATLTVTASATGASNKTATATIRVYAPVAQPTITRTGYMVSLATTSTNATIYYTTDGSTPSESNGTAYTTPFELTTSPTTVKAIAIRDEHTSTVASEEFQLKVATPVITIDQETGAVSVTCATDGATIHYTSGASPADPTGSNATFTSLTLSSGQTIKVIATKSGYTNSDIASQMYVKSGVSGGVVTLNDLEDHNWTYYAGVDASVDGGDYNTNYLGKLYSPDPRNVKITYKANGGAVSIDESETEFVYYKTIEKVDGTYKYTVISNPFSKRPASQGFGGWKIKEGAEYISGYNDEATLPLDQELTLTGLDANYTVNCISAEIELEATWVNLNNITYANGNNITYSVTGGNYETNILVLNRNVTGTITTTSPVTIMMVEPDGSADYRNSYTFTGNITPNNNGVSKIEFTKWNSTNTVNANFKNLWIGRGMTTTSQCATLITGLNTTTNTAGTKFSIKVESGKYDYFDFYKGHSTYTGGNSNGTATITGTAANAIITIGNDYDRAKASTNNQNLEFKYGPMLGYQSAFNSRNNRDNAHTLDLTIKSGRIGYTFFMENTNTANYLQGGAGYCMYLSSAGSQTNVGRRNVLIEGGDICTIGSGIDSYNNAPSNNDTPSDATNYNRLAFNVRIKGGTIHGNVYGGAAKSPSGGTRVMVMTGGQVKGWFAAGCNGTDSDGGQNYGTSYVYIGGKGKVDSEGSTKTLGYASGGNVYAAGAGRTGAATCGEMTFGSNLVIADKSYIERGAYGGGNYGYTKDYTKIYITGGTNQGNDGTVNAATTKGGVFGGANQQDGPAVTMYMTGGEMRGGVYGGCNTQGTISGNVEMHIDGGQVGTDAGHTANIHGGGYGNATRVSQNVEVTLGTGCNATEGVTVYGDVYGGSALGYVNGESAANTYHTYVTLNKGTIHGSLYGGGLGNAGNAANVYGPVQVKVFGGSVKKTDANGANGSGAVYGCNNINGAPQRAVSVDIYGTDPAPAENEYALFAVYGGGNQANYSYGTPTVKVHNCNNSIEYVYGGGNAAHITNGNTDVTIYGGNKIGNVFGGGNGTVTAANVSGDAVTKIYGGTIGRVFGGSNSQGTIGGTISVTAEAQTETGNNPCTETAYERCPIQVGELYGGGNLANSNVGSVSIGCMEDGDLVDYVYGGANQADITGNIALTMTGGRVGNLFGGNNTSGNISGSITVTVEWDGSCSNNYLGNVFGGGNLATFGTAGSPKAPTVNIYNGTVSGNVYGGGKGNPADHSKGQITGNPIVNIGDNNNNHVVTVEGDVYGGGDAGDVVGTPQVNVYNKCSTTIGYVYGGGNAADVSATDVNIDGGTILHDVFGGGHGDKATLGDGHSDKVANVNGNSSVTITGGTIGRVFAGSNINGSISGTDNELVINKSATAACPLRIGEAYGGGNMANGNATSITVGCTGTLTDNHTANPENIGTTLEGIGYVYGGANQANIGASGAGNESNIVVNINSGIVGNVFGGNNTSGNIYGTITVNIEKDNNASCASNWYVGNVFGGGNLAQYTGAPAVNILNGTVSQNVYGGGKGDANDHSKGQVTGDPVVTIGDNNNAYVAVVSGDVYGGGDAGNVVGTPRVNVINKCNTTIANVYGGGNAADVSGTNVTINGGTITGMVFGGGHGDITTNPQKEANVTGDVSVSVTGGTINKVFGGSNSKGNIRGNITLSVAKGNSSCDMHINEVYGGGNVAAGNAGTITIGCTGTASEGIGDVYGGANAAEVNSDITLNITGGKIGRVFGGNNTSGNIDGNIVVNVEWSGSCGVNSLDYVFGGGNQAAYGADNDNKGNYPQVNIKNGTVNNNVYGGGLGSSAIVYGNPQVTIGDANNAHVAVVSGDVYGGGDAAAVSGSTAVTYNDANASSSVSRLFGGGNAAGVSGTSTVTMTNGKVTGGIYGGCNTTGSVGNVTIALNGGTVGATGAGNSADVYGGGYGASTTTTGNIGVTLNGTTLYGDLYGGSALGSVNASASNTTTVTLSSATLHGSIFGGGKGDNASIGDGHSDVTATSEGKAIVNINTYDQYLEGIYGGANVRGLVKGDIDVNINANVGASGNSVDIFGGGYGANTATNGNVTVTMGDKAGSKQPVVYGDIYGGSALGNVNDAVADLTTVNIYNGTVHGNVYGGGLGAATLNGNGYIESVTTEAIVNGTVHVNIGASDQDAANCHINIDGEVFGCNNLAGTPKGHVYVDVYHTAHVAANTYPDPEPTTTADVTGLASSAFAIGAVYGGGNLADYSTTEVGASTHVHIHNCDNTIEYVYGGGNAASSPATDVVIDGGRFNYIFGGGNGAGTGNPGADIEGNASVTLNGGLIYRAFGGSNTRGNIGGTSSIALPSSTTCTRLVHEIFGGGNEAPGGSVDMTIPCGSTGVGTIYAGANNADMGSQDAFEGGNPVTVQLTIEGGDFDEVFGGNNTGGNIWGNVILNLKGGTIDKAFGGNNAGGTVKGTITVNVIEDESLACPLVLTDVYGGGKNAPYTPADASILYPQVNIQHKKNGTSILGSVFGGGLGTPAVVTANPVVTVGDDNAAHYATVNLNVYGGGEEANVAGNTKIVIKEAATGHTVINGAVFGGGKGLDDVSDAAHKEASKVAAKVTGSTTVQMTGGWVKTSIYGGGEMATVGEFHYATSSEAASYNAANQGATMAEGDVYSITSGGTTNVTVSGGIVGPDNIDFTDINNHGDVFGGGLGMAGSDYSNFAFVNTANVTISGGTVRGSVFGGGENGHVKGNTSVTVSGGTVGVRIPYAYRNISSDAGSSNPVYVGNVYGGGRGVDHTAVGNHLSQTAGRVYGNTSVSVTGGQIHHSVYGGGSLASVGTYTLTADATIYGGHLHNFTANTGNATVSVSGGRIGPTWAELLLDDAGNSLVDANGDALNATAATTIAKNYECLGENEGMVYGSGRGVNYTNDGNEDHQLYVEMAFTNNTTVTISGTADVVGSVFGGGENGHVKGNTQVNIQGGTIGGIPLHHKGFDLPGHSDGHGHINDDDDDDDELGFNETGIGRSVFRGNVYGGGRGIDHIGNNVTTTSAHIFSVSAGRVYGNTVVNVTGGRIYHNVFGGGSVASVGTYTYPENNFFTNPEAAISNTGKTTVNISGGQIGVMGENEGYVYGGGRGIAGNSESQVSHLAFVNQTEVNISSVEEAPARHADIRASVFGGGMNGHVLTNTAVTMSGGVVGGKTAANYGSGLESFDPDIFTAVPGTVDTTIHGVAYYSGIRPGDTITTSEGLGPATVFLGNVYGGGRGVDVYSGSNLSYTAGRVYGNTVVNITGGVVYHSVFGGGSIASVGTYTTYTAAEAAADSVAGYRIMENQPKTCAANTGKATVTVSGGRIGTNGRNNGRVFGSSRGMAGTSYRGLGYVNIAHVNIEDGWVRGSVFGSGENGHVLDSTLVTVSGGHIGNGKRTAIPWLNSYIGNVYGGGRGLDRSNPSDASTVSPFAGRVYKSANVVVTGGQIDHNVYGGGSLASVGRFKRDANNEITDNDPDKGIARVTVSGGTIGIDGDENGHVFGASRGTAVAYRDRNNDPRANLAYVAGTRVSVSGGHVWGSVFGGGESGHVQRDARVTVSGGEIGNAIPSDYNGLSDANKKKYDLMGNVYGAGRGIDEAHYLDNVGYSMSAGYVRGRTIVTITGTPVIHRNVYGGGSMGTVGDYGPYCRLDFWQGNPTTFQRGTEANNYLDASNGVATVVIKGAVGTATDVSRNYGGNVYGSCRGQANNPDHDSDLDLFYDEDGGFGEMAYVTGSHVIVGTGADVKGNVYGGGENGHVDFGGTQVDILAGTVANHVFGGGKGSTTSPTAGIVDGPTVVNIGWEDNGTYNGNATVGGNVFGGNDTYSSPLGVITVNIYGTAHPAGTAVGETGYALNEVYGGGNLAHVLTGTAATDYAGTIYDSKYIDQRLNSTGYNPSGYHPWPGLPDDGIRKSVVNVFGCYNTIEYVYGGGNAANCLQTDVIIDGGRMGHVFAGGNGYSATGNHTNPNAANYNPGANISGDAVATVHGGVIGQLFAGSNQKGDIGGNTIVAVDHTSSCNENIEELYGGGNEAASNGGEVTISCGAIIGDLYGGANKADIGTALNPVDLVVNVNGGTIDRVFGGNNTSGNIYGSITVNVEKAADCDLTLGYVYGGGNQAAYTPNTPGSYPSVNIKNGTVTHDVFGGGLGTTAIVTSNPVVTIGDLTAGHESYIATVGGNVYGGGDAASVNGNTTVTIQKANSAASRLFGGGNAAGITGTATVNANNGTISTGIYGGCNSSGTVTGDIAVNINGGTLGTSVAPMSGIFGGGYGASTATNGNVTVTIGDDAGTYTPTVYGDIYGGSALGNVNDAAADLTKVDFLNGTLHGNIYGGGLGDANNAAKVNGVVQVNIGSSTQAPANCHINLRDASIYGCNNTNGSPQDNVFVNIYRTGDTTGTYNSQYTGNDATYAIDQVFGGGNQADYLPENGLASSSKKTTVHIYECSNTIRRVFAGGNAAAATGVVSIIEGGRFDYVFGGGNGEVTAANIGLGGTNMTISAGIINELFGGSNAQGAIAGTSTTTINGDNMGTNCAQDINEFFGGGNAADITGDVSTTISCGTDLIGDIYGGCNQANITGNVSLTIEGGQFEHVFGGSKGAADKAANINGNVTLNIYGGQIDQAFGGCNVNGNITGIITVNVDSNRNDCLLDLNYVYGGGKDASYTPNQVDSDDDGVADATPISPVVNIKQGTVNIDVFGGGLGSGATVTANPQVNVGIYPARKVRVGRNVFGGGSQAAVVGNTAIDVRGSKTVVAGNVYGGGNQATVSGDTDVQVGNTPVAEP